MRKNRFSRKALRNSWRVSILFFIAISLSLIPAKVQAQGSAVLVYSHCLHCPGCFSDCPDVPPDLDLLSCPVCEEGAGKIDIPRTGQTACYNSNGNLIDCTGTGQDGHIQAGVVWPVPRFSDNGDGTIKDNLTGLTWLRDANCISTQYPGFDNDGAFGYQWGDGQITWQHALDFVAGINSGAYPNCGAGRSDWRIANINEIESVMNAGEMYPYDWLNQQGFAHVNIGNYWSSTTYISSPWIAWVFDTSPVNGTRNAAGKYSGNLYYVWPVAGITASPAQIPKTGQVKCYNSAEPWGEIPCAGTGQDGEIQAGAPWPLPRFIENSDGTITDNLTGLMWLKDANCFGSLTWQNVLNTISDFNANPGNYNCSHYTANYNDWRLSNINEQESLFNAEESNLAGWLFGEGLLFDNVQAYYYWSSTSRVDSLSTAVWAFDMIAGAVDPGSKNLSGLYAWPVRTAPPKFILTITKEGTGSGTVTSLNPAGIDCGPTCEAIYEEGTAVQLQAVPDTGYGFAGWSNDPDCADGIVIMARHMTCTATFSVETHTITIMKNGTGSGTVLIGGPGGPVVCGDDCEAIYSSGTGIILDAFPYADSDFAGWSGDPGCENDSLPLDANKTCIATFNLQLHNLIIGKGGDGSGTVISANMAGIDCGADCSELYPVGTIITLETTPDPWNEFSGWGGDPDCDDGVVTIGNADLVCFAIFNIQTYTLTIVKEGSGGGVVISLDHPQGISCGNDCSGVYNGGVEVTLAGGAEAHSLFTGWGGDPDCSDHVVTMDADKTCTATFEFLDDLQFQHMQMLRNESQKTPEFRFENGIPRFISMRIPIPAALPDDHVIRSLDFLDRYKYLYRVSDPKNDFFLKRIKTNQFDAVGGGTPDPAGRGLHLFFGQQKYGIPVHGASLAVHMRGDMITSTSGNYLTDIPDFTLPAVQSPAAEAIALEDVQGNNKKVIGVTKLFYYNRGLTAVGGGSPDPGGTPARLAWRVMVRGLRNSDGAGTSWKLFIDAQDGTVLSEIDELRTHGAEKDFDIETANNTTSDTCWNGLNTDDDEWFDEDGETGYPGAGGDPFRDGRKAFDFAHLTYDFYFDNFHHHSWNNGQGGVCGIFGCPFEAQVEVMVHVGQDWNNAAYVSSCDHLKFGEGYMSNDTFAHEFTHAVTRWSSDLEYENESGALDESYSDVMAAMLDDDWLEGEDKPVNGEDSTAGGFNDGGVGDNVREKGNNCGNGVDDDGDGFVDEGCPETGAQCGNGIDDEADGVVDIDEGCPETGNNCGNGQDDDGDNFVDEGCPGSCQDGIDNGLTGESDSADTDCITRDLANPSRRGDPDHLSADMSGDDFGIRVLAAGTAVNCDQNDPNYNDCGWVHTNSGIPNKAAYLLTMGGVHTGSGIEVRGLGGPGGDGREKARRLYYDVLTTRLFPNAFFIDARDETVEQAAEYAENNQYEFLNLDVCSVINAFAAVGLGASDIDCDGTADYRDGDNDGDGIRDNDDNCPGAANIQQDDMDIDGLGDKCDPDLDGDGDDNINDNCPTAANGNQADADIDGIGDACEDDDLDGVFNPVDNCIDMQNENQLDSDGDDIGNACDLDNDNDGVVDVDDNCYSDYNPSQLDTDGDGVGTACDNCRTISNSDQRDMDNDGEGNACDDDIDGDGTPNTDDQCPENALPVIISGGSEILPCRSNEELGVLFSGNYGDFVNGSFSFPSLTDSLKLPIFPCLQDGCADWIAEDFITEVSLSLPSDMDARIVDDRGFVISKGKPGTTKTMGFHPDADYFYRFQTNMQTSTLSRMQAAPEQTSPGKFYQGRSYFLEIYPSSDVVSGQLYSFTIRVQSRLVSPEDQDNDGYPSDIDCNDADAAIYPGASEVCDGVDNDCDGSIDENLMLSDGNACTEDRCDPVLGVYHVLIDPDDGNACTEDRCVPELGVFHALIDPDDGNACTEDICDPVSGAKHIPINAVEICDGVDNNCDGHIDEGVTQTWYRDADADGYSNGFRTERCDQPEGFRKPGELTNISGDCNDSNGAVNPGKVEGPSGDPTCSDTIDNDCDGTTDLNDQNCNILPQNNTPTKPTLTYPQNGANSLPTALTLKWDKSTDPDGDEITYKLYIGVDTIFTGVNPVILASLLNSGFYYAMVFGSPIDIFLILFGIVGIPGLSRKRGKMGLFVIIAIVVGVVIVSCGSGGGGVGDNPPPESGGAYKVENLKPNTTYYWKVVADDGKGGATESNIYSFTTGK